MGERGRERERERERARARSICHAQVGGLQENKLAFSCEMGLVTPCALQNASDPLSAPSLISGG